MSSLQTIWRWIYWRQQWTCMGQRQRLVDWRSRLGEFTQCRANIDLPRNSSTLPAFESPVRYWPAWLGHRNRRMPDTRGFRVAHDNAQQLSQSTGQIRATRTLIHAAKWRTTRLLPSHCVDRWKRVHANAILKPSKLSIDKNAYKLRRLGFRWQVSWWK